MVNLTDAKNNTQTPYNLTVNVYKTVLPTFSVPIDASVELVVGTAK